jgi:DnaJ family protein C protein 13
LGKVKILLLCACTGPTASTSGGGEGSLLRHQREDAGRGLRGNWDAFWAAAMKDHCHAGLIWNERTRSELREALQVHAAPTQHKTP